MKSQLVVKILDERNEKNSTKAYIEMKSSGESPYTVPVDIRIIIDLQSEGDQKETMRIVNSAIRELLKQLTQQDKFAYSVSSKTINFFVPKTWTGDTERKQINKRIEDFDYEGVPRRETQVDMGYSYSPPSGSLALIILLTDGCSDYTTDKKGWKSFLENARLRKVPILICGIEANADMSQLEEIAKKVGWGSLYRQISVTDFEKILLDELNNLRESVVENCKLIYSKSDKITVHNIGTVGPRGLQYSIKYTTTKAHGSMKKLKIIVTGRELLTGKDFCFEVSVPWSSQE